MEQLMEILKELRPDVDFETEKALIDNVSLIGELNDAFGVEIEFEDMEPENFNSAEDMYKLIQRLQQEA